MRTKLVTTGENILQSVLAQNFGEVVVQTPAQLALDSRDEMIYIAIVDEVNAERIKDIFRHVDWTKFPLMKVVIDEGGMSLTDEIVDGLGRCQIAAKKTICTEKATELIIGLLRDPIGGIKGFDNEDSWILAYGSGYPS